MEELTSKVLLIKCVIPHDDLLLDYLAALAKIYKYKRFYARNYLEVLILSLRFRSYSDSYQDKYFNYVQVKYLNKLEYLQIHYGKSYLTINLTEFRFIKIDGLREKVSETEEVYKYEDPIISLINF